MGLRRTDLPLVAAVLAAGALLSLLLNAGSFPRAGA